MRCGEGSCVAGRAIQSCRSGSGRPCYLTEQTACPKYLVSLVLHAVRAHVSEVDGLHINDSRANVSLSSTHCSFVVYFHQIELIWLSLTPLSIYWVSCGGCADWRKPIPCLDRSSARRTCRRRFAWYRLKMICRRVGRAASLPWVDMIKRLSRR